MERETQGKIALVSAIATGHRSTRPANASVRPQPRPSRGNFSAGSPVKEVWGRINIDIATFLTAMESVSSDDSEENYQALLDATDRLLWGSARTRLELERLLEDLKRSQITRRLSG